MWISDPWDWIPSYLQRPCSAVLFRNLRGSSPSHHCGNEMAMPSIGTCEDGEAAWWTKRHKLGEFDNMYIYIYINLMELNSSCMVNKPPLRGVPIFFLCVFYMVFHVFFLWFSYGFPSYKLPWLALSHQAGSDLCDICHDSCSAHWAVRGGVQWPSAEVLSGDMPWWKQAVWWYNMI